MRNIPGVVVHLQDAMSTAGEDVKIFMPSPFPLLPTVRRMGRLLFIDCMALTTATTKANWDGWRVKKNRATAMSWNAAAFVSPLSICWFEGVRKKESREKSQERGSGGGK